MKTKKQIFHLRPPEPDPYLVKNPSYFESAETLIIWSVKMFDHQLIMPELVLLIESNYFEN